jgi:membrane protein
VSNTPAGYWEGVKNRLRRFVQLWIDLFDRHLLLDHASAIAFQVLKSAIPLTLLGLAILGASGEQKVWRKTIAPAIEPHLQKPTFHAIDYGVEKIFSSDSTGLIAFAALLSLWYISGAVRAVIGAMNDIYETEDKRSWPKRYAISFALAACIGLGVIGALLSTIILGHVRGPLEVVAQIGRWILAIALLAIALGLLVRFAPAKHRSKKWAGAGSALVVVTWIGATLIFELFVSHIANFKTATGELTVFLVLIGYVYTSSIILMVGLELDELLREDATGRRGALHVLFGYGK